MSNIFLNAYLFLFLQKSVFIFVFGERRIIGGIPVQHMEDHPYMAALQRPTEIGETFCGGSIIDQFWILTAAHCLCYSYTHVIVDATEIVVVVGILNFYNKVNNDHIHLVSKLFIHKEFSWISRKGDIGLIRLKNKLKFTEKVQPIKLPNENSNNGKLDFRQNINCEALGWGVHENKTNKQLLILSKNLKIVTLPIISNNECSRYYNYEYITNDNICTLYNEGGKDTCYGDSGGPLLCEGQIVGITSWGKSCANPISPGVYTRVERYAHWIKYILSNQNLIIFNYLLIFIPLIIM